MGGLFLANYVERLSIGNQYSSWCRFGDRIHLPKNICQRKELRRIGWAVSCKFNGVSGEKESLHKCDDWRTCRKLFKNGSKNSEGVLFDFTRRQN